MIRNTAKYLSPLFRRPVASSFLKTYFESNSFITHLKSIFHEIINQLLFCKQSLKLIHSEFTCELEEIYYVH
jgi:hypothetical protein